MKNIIKKCSIAVIVALGISLTPGSVRTSKEGQQKIAGWEDCRSTPYYCTAGVLTVGIGSTGGVENREYSNQEIARRWVNDLQRAENCINNNFHGADMPQLTFEATIWKHAQARQWPQMCNRLTDFVNAGGKRSPGLVNRRNDFKAWCLLGLSTPS